MPALKDQKKIGATYTNAEEIVKVVYDFAADTGAIATYDAFKSQGICHARLIGIQVETAVTSGGAVTFDVGVEGGVEFASNIALASLGTIGLMYQGAALANTQYVRLTDGQDITFKIEAFAVTAGKIHLMFGVVKGF